ncbi:MAG: PDZ domain-containing protein [Longimicrobiales bacterium]
MNRTIGLWIVLLALAFPGLGTTQEVVTLQTNRGWIGITFNYAMGLISGEERTVVVIEDVVNGSPAEEAGLRVGDTLTHIDGQPVSQRVFASLGTLEVGDLVRMTVRRNNRPVEILVEAGSRQPRGWVLMPNSGEMVVHLDSMRGAILENLDSLRLNIARVGPDSLGRVSVSFLEPPTKGGGEGGQRNFIFRFPPMDSLEAMGGFFLPEALAVPLEALVAETAETDSLKVKLQQLRRALTEVRRAELTRLRELRGSLQRPIEEIAGSDEKLRQLRTRERELLEEQALANQQLRRLSDEIVRRRMARIQEEQTEALARIRESRLRSGTEAEEAQRVFREQYESRRPLSHVFVGQSFVAGAQLTPLNPALAEYFHVEEGVLVTEVLEGTPAAQAGMQSGDVIVRVGSETVSSLDDLRFAVGYLDRPLRIRVVRKGSPMEIVIGK